MLRFVVMEHGVLSVTLIGVSRMLKWCVVNLDILLTVSNNRYECR